MAQKNAINNKTSDLTIDPGASGDSFIQFDINTTSEFRIGVDDTDDSFRISQGSALGTTDTMVITPAGEVRKPLNPAFSAYEASATLNVTGDGTSYVFGGVALTEIFDQGGNFVTSGTFTAPVTGNYLLTLLISFRSEAAGGGGTTCSMKIVTSNRTFETNFNPTRASLTGYYGVNVAIAYSSSVLADMDASDTATVQVLSSGGAKVDDIIWSGAMFSGTMGMLAV